MEKFLIHSLSKICIAYIHHTGHYTTHKKSSVMNVSYSALNYEKEIYVKMSNELLENGKAGCDDLGPPN